MRQRNTRQRPTKRSAHIHLKPSRLLCCTRKCFISYSANIYGLIGLHCSVSTRRCRKYGRNPVARLQAFLFLEEHSYTSASTCVEHFILDLSIPHLGRLEGHATVSGSLCACRWISCLGHGFAPIYQDPHVGATSRTVADPPAMPRVQSSRVLKVQISLEYSSVTFSLVSCAFRPVTLRAMSGFAFCT